MHDLDVKMSVKFLSVLQELHYAVFSGTRPLLVQVLYDKLQPHENHFTWNTWVNPKSKDLLDIGNYTVRCHGLGRYIADMILKHNRLIRRNDRPRRNRPVFFPGSTNTSVLTAIASHEIRHEVQAMRRYHGMFSPKNCDRTSAPVSLCVAIKQRLDFLADKRGKHFNVDHEYDANLIEYMVVHRTSPRAPNDLQNIATIILTTAP